MRKVIERENPNKMMRKNVFYNKAILDRFF